MNCRRSLSRLFAALGLFAILASSSQAATVTIDPSEGWIGYMNWTHEYPARDTSLDGASGWGFGDLTAALSADSLTLGPNQVNPQDGLNDTYWYDSSSGLGTKEMEASAYVEKTDVFNGQDIAFVGQVSDYSLSSDYTLEAFIADFAADYSSASFSTQAIPGTGSFSVSMTTSPDSGRHVQYGFRLRGRNIHPSNTSDLSAAGTVTLAPMVVPEPEGVAGLLLGAGFLAISGLRRRR